MPGILLMWVLPGLEGEATGKTGALSKGREHHFPLLLPQLLQEMSTTMSFYITDTPRTGITRPRSQEACAGAM